MGLANWANFFAAEVGASAALVGLVTVAISINLARILAMEHLPGRAAESLLTLTAALTICGVALFPDVSPTAFGGVALALAVVSLVFGVRNQLVWRRQIGWEEIERQAIGAAARLASALPIGVGGLMLLLRSSSGVNWIAAGVVVTLVVSVLNAWVLLVEINR